MAKSSELQCRIEDFVESLESEFGPVAQGKHNCLVSAIEDFGVQVGDEVAKTIAQKKAAKQIVQEEPTSDCCCPVFSSLSIIDYCASNASVFSSSLAHLKWL